MDQLSHQIHRLTDQFSVDLASFILGPIGALLALGAISPDDLGRTDRILAGLVTMALIHADTITFKVTLGGIKPSAMIAWILIAIPLGILQVVAAFWGVLTLIG